MRCGLVALALDKPLPTPVLGTLPGAAAESTRLPDDTVLARTRGEGSGRRCDGDVTRGVQQMQPRNDNRRAGDMGRFLLFCRRRFKSVCACYATPERHRTSAPSSRTAIIAERMAC